MLSFFNTLKVKLFLSYFIFILLTACVASISFWFYQKRENLGDVSGYLEQAAALNVQMAKNERDFFGYDAVNMIFYQTGKSLYLEHHKEAADNMRITLRELKRLDETRDFKISREVDTLLSQLDRYTGHFEKIISQTRLRGYKDFGLEGEMRQYAHTLEDGSFAITEVQLLMLRRHEKDYIIRKDTAYAGKFEQLSRYLLAGLEKSPQSEKIKTTHTLLKNYQGTFRKLVASEKRMGHNQQQGLRKELNEAANDLENTIQLTLQKVSGQTVALRDNFQFIFLTVLTSAVLISLVLSYVLAVQITRPMVTLSNHINKIVESDFSGDIQHLPITSTDEVGRLTHNFNLMTDRIESHLQDINRKAKVLQKQNMQLQSINLKLIASENKLRSLNSVKDKFFSIISHDLKGPLHTLTGFLQILIHYTSSFTEEELKEFAESMDASVKRLLTMLENLLQWSRSQTGNIEHKPEVLGLNTILQENLHLFTDTAKAKNITLVTESGENMLVRADKNMLEFVLRNLTSNALKFTREAGNVKITAHAEPEFTEITVQDNGVGISPEDMKKIFQPDIHFSTPGTGKEKGTGFGLLLCKDFVEKNGGKIAIDSQPGKGTSLTFTLPTVHEKVMADV
jgi:signal transduction histidine kinase